MFIEPENLGFSRLSVRRHGPELENPEWFATCSHAGLPEKDWAWRVQLDRKRDDCRDRRQDEDAKDGESEVERAFCGQRGSRKVRAWQRGERKPFHRMHTHVFSHRLE